MEYLQNNLDPRYWPLGVDVYPTWNATRALWRGENPYSGQVQLETQRLIYGRPSHPDEDSFWFYYPPYIAVVTLPLAVFPVQTAALIWTASLCALLMTLIGVWAWNLKPRPVPWMFGLIVLGGIFFRPAATSVINGQYALFILVASALVWWLIEHRIDRVAGALLAVVTFKPSVALLAPLILMAWAVLHRRWGLLAGFVGALGILFGLPMLRIGWWLPDFVGQTLSFDVMHRGEGLALAWSPEEIFSLAGIVWLMGTLALVGIGLVQMARSDDSPWVAIIGAVNLNLILTPHLVEYDLVMMLIPLLWLGAQWMWSRWLAYAWLLLIWLPWLSWMVVILSGRAIDAWWSGIWRFYPSLLIGATLLSLGWMHMQRSRSSAYVPAATGPSEPPGVPSLRLDI